MRVLKMTALAVGALAALSAASLTLPRHVSVERSTVVQAAPDAILTLAASSDGFQRFNPYLTLDPDLKIAPYGPPEGVGAGFHFDGRDGSGTQTIAEIRKDAVVYFIDLGAMGKPRQTIHAKATEGGSLVTWRVDSDMGYNPVFRVFGMFMDGMMGPTFELGLENLSKAAA